MKKEYAAPAVEDLGSLRELTLGARDGESLDATFPVGTSRGELGFFSS
jgi:hypothetical protein